MRRCVDGSNLSPHSNGPRCLEATVTLPRRDCRTTKVTESNEALAAAIRALLEEVAPRRGQEPPALDTGLGYGGYGLTLIEYLWLRQRVEEVYRVPFHDGAWPVTVREFIEMRNTP